MILHIPNNYESGPSLLMTLKRNYDLSYSCRTYI